MLHKRILSNGLTAIVFLSLINWGCTKFDTTKIGADLLPAVDNVHTFADTLDITSIQGAFNDTTKVTKTMNFALGAINNDLLFGTTRASVYMQLKPKFYPFYFGNDKDTLIGVDSVILCLKYNGFWGDSSLPQNFDVYEVQDDRFKDSIYETHDINYAPTLGTPLVSGFTVDTRKLGDTVKYKNGRDYSIGLIRIPMPLAWAAALFGRDSSGVAGNNAFYSDSTFRKFYNGLAVVPSGGGGNSLLYLNIADTSTKLEVHFRKRNRGIVDTFYQSLVLTNRVGPPSGTSEPGPSSVANNIIRNRAGFPVSTSATPSELYLQTGPGTYATLDIPALSTMSNRIIHRAEIIIQQIPVDPVSDAKLAPPALLYIDLKDTSATPQWKPLYYDLNPNTPYNPDDRTGFYGLPSTIDYLAYGGYPKDGKDKFGNTIKIYNINVTRNIQQLVTKHTPNYQMRLFAPYQIYYPQTGSANYPATPFPYGNNIAAGRVKIGGGANPNYKMIMRIIYSKL